MVSPLERCFLVAVRWLIPGLIAALPLLLINKHDDLLVTTTVQLSAIVLALLALSLHVAPITDERWFTGIASDAGRLFATAAAVVALVTGYAALITLTSSAALRLDPSMQFLQLLSALDIAWVVSATVIGVRWRWGVSWGRAAGTMMAIVCVWSIWRYLDQVGFGAEGQWLVSRDALMRLVLPFDTVAAVIAVGAVLVGMRHRQAT